MKEIIVSDDIFNLVAERFIEIANDAILERGRFVVALAGGSTPKELYKILATKNLDWTKVFFFFGDERNVLIDSIESNFKMADETLFKPLNINQSNIYRWKTELQDIEKIAEDYAEKVNLFGKTFDLILLGIGTDGHTASLFPHTKALHETEKIAVENWVEQLNTWRFTLTFSTINNAKNVIFLVKGEDKSETLKKVLEGEFLPEELPSQSVKPKGNLLWFIDKSAAGKLKI
ncbi:MAG: 6-phosphogluconolactonase [Pyrinomonadaceae bacterium]|nr:6-phosphogluconolactonase [Pyrinomonadaceae bacterium]